MIFKDFQKFGEPGGMGGPGRASDKLTVGESVGDGEGDEGGSGEFYFWSAGRIGVDALAGDDSGSGEDLRAVAESGDGLVALSEVADDFEDSRIEAKVFGGATARDDKGIVAGRVDVCERGIEGKVVAAFF